MSGWTNEFQNAMAWFAAAPVKLANATAEKIGQALDAAEAGIEFAAKSVKDTVTGAAEWMWVVLQGDFAEDQSTAQIVTNTVISMIPVVDQICDVRDIVANAKKIHEVKEGEDSTWHWVALVLTLIGLFPVLGSFFKGCFKVLFKYIRKGLHQSGGVKAGEAIWKVVSPWLEKGIAKLNEFLARPEVRKYISQHRFDNVYKAIADKIREVAAAASPRKLLNIMDELVDKLKEMVKFIEKWGGSALATKARQLLEAVTSVRLRANAMIAKALQPVQDLLYRTAKRLDIEQQMMYRAATNNVNPSRFYRVVDTEAAEVKLIQAKRPKWADDFKGKQPHPGLDDIRFKNDYDKALADFKAGKLKEMPPDLRTAPKPLTGKYDTFSDIRHDVIPEGEVIYRVLDPASNDNSYCWMTKAEFDKLKSKDDWRRKFAVWANWNANGEVVTYTVPPGGLPVWRGTTASQVDKASKVILEGGFEQIVVDPKKLDFKNFGPRQATGWSYSDLGGPIDLTGVPKLQHNFYK